MLCAMQGAGAQALMCPAGPGSTALSRVTSAPPARDLTAQPIQLQADDWEATVNGSMTLSGNVTAQQGERSVTADALLFNPQTRDMSARGQVTYDDPIVLLGGTDANLHGDGGADIVGANFVLKQASGRGSAQRITLSPQGNLDLKSVSYTSCPPQSVGWQLSLRELYINQRTQTGTGRHVKLTFAGVPIFYSPWLSFPVGNQRKSGFLFPVIGSSSRGGQSLATPWYWNLASNYDDTITPSIDTARGFKLDNEFRYLGTHSKALVTTGYLPHDNKTKEWRGHIAVSHQYDPDSRWRWSMNGESVRDHAWFEDFGQGQNVTSLVYLPRQASLNHYGDYWHSSIDLLQLQTLDDSIARSDRPYKRLPAISVSAAQPLPLGVELSMDSELAYFTRGDLENEVASVRGARWHLAPELRFPLRGAGIYLAPAIGWRYTGYALEHVAADASRHPSLSAPMYSVESGLIFERLSSNQERLYTLEPRLLYAYIPWRDQRSISTVFDTSLLTFDQSQLFEANRFVGPDRLSDANQITAALSSRMLSTADGTEYLSGTLGQVYYLRTPCITSLTQLVCDSNTPNQHSSDVYAQVSLASYRHVSVSLGAQWSPVTQSSNQRNLTLQYRLDGSRVVNVAYRFARGTVEQWEASAAWPLTRSISGYGRIKYSQLDRKVTDQFAGFEYRACCWNVRALVGKSVVTRSGDYDTQFKLQLELKGLSSVGTADSYLQSSIPGYSAREAAF